MGRIQQRSAPLLDTPLVAGPITYYAELAVFFYRVTLCVKAVFQLRFEYDSSAIRARFDYEGVRDAYSSTIQVYNILRGAYEELSLNSM